MSARRSLSFNSLRRADDVTTATASQEADDDTDVSQQGDDDTDAAQQVDDVTSASQSCLPLDDTECPPPAKKARRRRKRQIAEHVNCQSLPLHVPVYIKIDTRILQVMYTYNTV